MCPHTITIFSFMKSSAIICKHRNIMVSFEPIEQTITALFHPRQRIDLPAQTIGLVDPTHVFHLPSYLELRNELPRHDHHATTKPPARMIVVIFVAPIPTT